MWPGVPQLGAAQSREEEEERKPGAAGLGRGEGNGMTREKKEKKRKRGKWARPVEFRPKLNLIFFLSFFDFICF